MSVIYNSNLSIDKDSFQRIFIEYYSSLVCYANKIIKNSMQSEDIVQSVFVDMWENRSNKKIVKSLSSYLYTAVRNKSINYLRDNKKNETLGADYEIYSDINIENYLIEEESMRLIISELENLPPKCKLIMNLSLSGFKSREIAEELSIAIETVKKQKQKAVKFLYAKALKVLSILVSFYNI